MTQPTSTQSTTITPVTEDTQALVNQQMSEESDAIKQKMGELVDLIKQSAEAELKTTENMTREAYIKAMNNVQSTLRKTQAFFETQESAIERSIQTLSNGANHHWETFVADIKDMGDRIDRAVSAAWKELAPTNTDASQ